MNLEVLLPFSVYFLKIFKVLVLFLCMLGTISRALWSRSLSLTSPLFLTVLGYQVRSRWDKHQCLRTSPNCPCLLSSFPWRSSEWDTSPHPHSPVSAWGWAAGSAVPSSCFSLFPCHYSWLSPCVDCHIFLIGIWSSMKALRLLLLFSCLWGFRHLNNTPFFWVENISNTYMFLANSMLNVKLNNFLNWELSFCLLFKIYNDLI